MLEKNNSCKKELKGIDDVFSTVLQKISVGIILIDENGLPYLWNQSANNFLSLVEKNWHKKPFEVILKKGRVEKFNDYKNIFKQDKEATCFNCKLFFNKEKLYVFKCEISSIKNVNKIKAIIVISDITEEEFASSQLKEREEQLTTLINSTPDIICFKDGEGRWIEANKADIELFSLYGVDYRGKTDSELAEYTHPVYRNSFLTCEQTDKKVWEKGGISRGDEIIVKPNGEIKVYDVIKSPIFNKDGSRKGIVVIGRDITERKKLEEELNKSIRFTELLLNIATQFIGVSVENFDDLINESLALVGKFLNVSRAYVFKYDFENGIMVNTYEWCNKGVEPQKDNLQSVPIKNFPEWVNPHLNGQYVCINSVNDVTGKLKEVLAQQSIKSTIELPIMLKKKCVGFVGFDTVDKERKWGENEINVLKVLTNIYANIENFKLIEREKDALKMQVLQYQKMESLGELALNIAHDLNNYLQVIIGASELLSLYLPEEKEVKEFLKDINDACIAIETFTSKLLTFGRKEPIKFSFIDLNKLIEKVSSMMEKIVGDNINISFSPYINKAIVFGDSLALEEVFINLCFNARDAMPDGGKLTIKISKILADNDFVKKNHWAEMKKKYFLIEVKDTGVGIPKETVDKIFDPFFTTKGADNGTGLGLAIVYSIIKQHGGLIEVESQVGVGTNFKIFLPEADLKDARVVDDSLKNSKEVENKLIILFKNKTTVESVTSILLKKIGFDLIELSNQEDLFILLERNKKVSMVVFDIVLFQDYYLSVFDRFFKNFPDIPFLIIGGYSLKEFVFRRLSVSERNFLQKPFPFIELEEKIKDIITNN